MATSNASFLHWMFQKYVEQDLRTVLKLHDMELAEGIEIDQITEYIVSMNETEVYTAEDWYCDTRANYPEYLVDRSLVPDYDDHSYIMTVSLTS